MGCQTGLGGAISAGSGRSVRTDPLALPVRFTAPDAVADGRVRLVEIDRHRVLLSRSVRGMSIRLNLPTETFMGVAVRMQLADGAETAVLTLEHRDPALSIELCAVSDDSDVVAEWQVWADVFGLPLLTAEISARLRQPPPRPCAVAGAPPAPRRRRRNAIKRRRPAQPLRRKSGIVADAPAVHRENEIIARN